MIAGLIPASDPGGVEAQAWAVQPFVEAGNVYLPDPTEWPEVEEWLDEVCRYPKAAFNDRTAAFVQAMMRFKRSWRQKMPAADDNPVLSEAAQVAQQRF